jgi:hypothetical protein
MVGLHSAPQPNNRGCLVPAWLRSRGESVLLEVNFDRRMCCVRAMQCGVGLLCSSQQQRRHSGELKFHSACRFRAWISSTEPLRALSRWQALSVKSRWLWRGPSWTPGVSLSEWIPGRSGPATVDRHSGAWQASLTGTLEQMSCEEDQEGEVEEVKKESMEEERLLESICLRNELAGLNPYLLRTY